MVSIKENKAFQFAIGVTLVVLLIRWLITGDLLFAATTAMQPEPKEGETKSVAILSVIWPMFFDAMVILGASAIAGFFKLWDALYGLIQSAQPTAPEQAKLVSSAPVEATPISAEALIQSFARAAAMNDGKALQKISRQIRKPYAMQELSQAFADGDLERVKRLTAELTAMITEPKPSPVSSEVTS